jgi:hypothetical protein
MSLPKEYIYFLWFKTTNPNNILVKSPTLRTTLEFIVFCFVYLLEIGIVSLSPSFIVYNIEKLLNIESGLCYTYYVYDPALCIIGSSLIVTSILVCGMILFIIYTRIWSWCISIHN